jgi:hypothetical protein
MKPVAVYAFPDGSDILDLVQKMDSEATVVVRRLWRRKVVERAIELLDAYVVSPELFGEDLQGESALELAARYINADLRTVFVNTLNNRSAGLSLQVTFSRETFTFSVLAAVDVYSEEMGSVVAGLDKAVSRGVQDGSPVDSSSQGGALVWNFDAASATDGEFERLCADTDDLAALVAEYGSRERRLTEEVRMRELYEQIFAALDGPSTWRDVTIDDFPAFEVADLLRVGAPVA